MKKIGYALSLLALSLTLATLVTTGAWAAEDKPQTSVTGTITKMTSDDLFLQTEQGPLKFDFNKKTAKPAETLAVGSRVTIWYDSDDTGKHELDARRIEMATVVTPEPQATAPPPTVENQPVQTSPPPQETTPPTQESTPLPKTASPLPLMGAVGLLSLLGSAILLKQGK